MAQLFSEKAIEEIKEKFILFQRKIELDSTFNHHNLKLYGENFYKEILNIINPEANFENTNLFKSNFPAIDLICKKTKRCIQVTSDRSKTKIVKTIKKFKELKKDTLDDNYEVQIYYLLEKANPQKINELELELKTINLGSILKDGRNLISEIENLEQGSLEKILKLFVIDETFLNSYEKLIISIEKQINEIQDIQIQVILNKSLVTVREYFKCNLDLLFEIMKQIDCETINNKKNDTEKYTTMMNYLVFLILTTTYSSNTKYPKHEYSSVLIDSYKSWIFNSSIKHMSLDHHIGKIALYISLQTKTSIDDGICYITSLRNNGGLSCQNCTDGLLANTTDSINKIVIDFTDADSIDLLKDNTNFMDLKKGQKIDFKCGECISNIDEHMKAKKIFMEVI
jgi:hypothetical protein